MILGLCLTVVLGCGLTVLATRWAAGRPRQRDLDRRFRQLGRHPERVTHRDVEHLLLAESVPGPTVGRVLGLAASRQMNARTMWRWAVTHGAARLVMVLDAGLAEDTLLEHLDAGTAPDWYTLDVFAGLAADVLPGGIPVDELIDLDVVPEPEDLTYPPDLADWTLSPDPLELRQFHDLPPISGPGLTPFRPIATFDGDDDWPTAPYAA